MIQKTIILAFILFILTFGTNPNRLNGQQTFQSSLTYLDKYSINPGYGGMDDRLSITGSYRSQWQGIDGNPEFIRLNAHLPLYNISGGAGLLLKKEAIGVESNLLALMSYNQVFEFNFGILSIAARGGILNKKLKGEDLISALGSYENGGINHNDQYLPATTVNGFAPSWGIGAYFFSRSFDFGIVFDDYPVMTVKLDGIAIQKSQSVSIHGNYFLHLTDQIQLGIYGLMRTDFVQWQMETGILGRYRQVLFSSFQLRGYSEHSFDAVSLAVGGRLNKNLSLAYSYDITLSPLRQISNGTHEIVLNYLMDVGIGKKIPQRIIHSPRLYD